jgi:hypothetical protein
MLRHALALYGGDVGDPEPTSPFGSPVTVHASGPAPGSAVTVRCAIDARETLKIGVH